MAEPQASATRPADASTTRRGMPSPVEVGGRAAWALRVALRHAARALGLKRAFRSEDRVLLEETILPHYAGQGAPLEVLFVGTQEYTRHYEAMFRRHRFVSMDVDPAARKFGSTRRHVTASAAQVADHFDAESVDVVIFNGVFGWGLDEREAVEAAISGFHRVLRPGGQLVVGWNRVGRHRPFEFAEVRALAGFERIRLPPLGRAVVDVPGVNWHRYEFFAKRASAATSTG
jgi:SAM-dependent methyltransferase